MRGVGGLLALIVCVVLGTPLTAQAQEACTKPGALGVERTLEVDTTGGPIFGEPYGNPDFLKPGEVVLTFDDGPMPGSTRAILAALAAECTKATFFMVGSMATAYPDVVREVVARGHTVGAHTWSHANLRGLSEAGMRSQIESGFTAVEKAAGSPIAPFFRYPYLANSHAATAYLKSRDIAQFDVDVDSSDWLLRNAQRVVQRVMSRLEARGRGIILLHDIHGSTALAIPALLGRLKEKGYKVVHLQSKAPAQVLVAFDAPARPSGLTGEPRRRRTWQAKAEQAEPVFSWLPW
jgi:peptidoglycan/xylan/chitin deacetylase (PgdA/CDA1 family)